MTTTNKDSATIKVGSPESRGGMLGETFEDVERSVAQLQMLVLPDTDEGERERAVAPRAISLGIAGVRTASQAGSQNVFLWNSDALTLIIDITASSDLVASGAKFDANFEIIDYATNAVKVSQWWRNTAFSWGTNFWISMGNNWGPTPNDYTTPQRWGINRGIHSFRATVEVLGINAFAFSTEHVFRTR